MLNREAIRSVSKVVSPVAGSQSQRRRRSAALCGRLASFLLALAAPGFAEAARPAAVPSDYVEVPAGYMHPSCVHELAPGETVEGNGSIKRADGTRRWISQCTLPRYDSRGRLSSGGQTASGPGLPTVNGWMAYVYQLNSSAFEHLVARWVVPANPPVWDTQIVYLFPAFEDNPVTRIIQPVLAWNGYGAKGNHWVIYSWYVFGNDAFYS